MVKSMDKNEYYNHMFLIAALWNWIIAIIMILISIFSPSTAKDFGMEVPPTWFFYHLMWFFVFLIGILFFVIGRDLEKYHGLIFIFVIEKLGAFLISLAYYLIGDVNEGGLLVGVVDLIFGILFIEFLIKYK